MARQPERPCSTCGSPLDPVTDCHHHNTSEHTDDVGNTVVQCDDCPQWWVLTPEED